MARAFITDGATKSADLLDSDDPEIWRGLTSMSARDQDVYYARVAAAFRAFNLKANTVGNMPFALLRGKEEFDVSATWENKVGFLPNPSELFRLDTLSYMATNAIYNVMTTDRLGYKPRGLHFSVPHIFTPYTDPATEQLAYIERRIGAQIERYAPDGTSLTGGRQRLIYMWRLDHTTEVLPSRNTEALAIMQAAGVMFHKGFWIKHFYQRGGIRPTLIAMKGLIDNSSKDEKEKSWTDWLLGLGRRAFARVARIYNAEAIDAKPIGDGVGDMKDNKIHEEALADIAMGTGMPLSLLLANSSNYATAKEEKATWYENDIGPFCNWLAYEYNRQVFEPMGLRLEFRPETLDPQQEDEVLRAQAMNTFVDAMTKCQTFEVFEGWCETMGLEISDKLRSAAETFYAEKKEREAEMQEQMSRGGYVVGADGRPVPAQTQAGQPDEQPAEDEDEETEEPRPPAKAAVKASENSTMIALRIPDTIRAEIAERYPFVDDETLAELHITLIYLGDGRTLNTIDIIRAVSEFAGIQSPIKGTLQGLARFVNGGERDPLVVTFDSPQMPHVFSALAGCLDAYHVPYHRDHGFIPHMTLAYIPADADMPIDTIEPMEINFSEIHIVDGGQWMPIQLLGTGNKTAAWVPSLDELGILSDWRSYALRRHNKGKPHDEPYKSAADTLPTEVFERILERLGAATTDEGIKAAFVVGETVSQAPSYKTETISDPGLVELAAAINKLAEAQAK